MTKITFFLLLMTSFFLVTKTNGHAYAAEQITLPIPHSDIIYRTHILGRFIPMDPKNTNLVYRTPYYFYFEQDGKKYLYPVEMDKKAAGKLKKIIASHTKDSFWVEADVNFVQIKMEKNPLQIALLRIREANPLRLSWLGVPYDSKAGMNKMEDKWPTLFALNGSGEAEDQSRGRSTIMIPDNLAEGLLFLSGASLLTSMLTTMSLKSLFLNPVPNGRPIF